MNFLFYNKFAGKQLCGYLLKQKIGQQVLFVTVTVPSGDHQETYTIVMC